MRCYAAACCLPCLPSLHVWDGKGGGISRAYGQQLRHHGGVWTARVTATLELARVAHHSVPRVRPAALLRGVLTSDTRSFRLGSLSQMGRVVPQRAIRIKSVHDDIEQ